ncbi:unnamed protein product [Lactuca saligna]|uniref:J domain-containing protein n=1 Tax=Lactuca saligna TaxID=75948 RepID=A0AA35Z1X1_LACSI|nr:unnamed protein product [Lactuca saligna]
MESLSRPFLPRKLSNATTFSPRNSYDGVFSGHRHNYTGASPIDVQDYREIFANSPAASSIPVLDLSTLREPSSDALNLNLHLNLNFRSSEPDYSKIFGGIRDEDVAVSYEELFARDKARAPSSKTSSPDSDNLSHHSADVLKQFNMSYNKISRKNKDGLDHGTRHVTQLHAIPGFTRFIDEAVPPLMEAKKQDSAEVHVSLDSIKRSKHHPTTVSSPSSSPNNIVDHKDYPKRSTTMNSESCESDASESYFDAEGDANSAASASAAALKKAIEKAQESIRIAKESVGRKKKGLRSFSSKSFKDSLKVEEPKCKDEVRGVFERNAASVTSQAVGRNRKYGDTVVFPDFMDSEKLSVAKRVIDEIHGKFSESTKESSILKDNTIVSNSTQVTHETVEIDISRESKENTNEVRPNYADELVTESNDLTISQKVEEDEKKLPLESVLSDNEKQEEVLEQEHLKNAEKSDDEASDNIQESKESEGICHNKLQKDDFEKKQEDNHIGDQKVETFELDHNVIEEMETHKYSKVDMNDNNEETTQEVDDDDTEAMKETEDEVIEKTSIDQTSSDDYEDEYEVKSDDTNGSESNDVESESSSSREEEESQTNIQLPHNENPTIETTKETIDDVAAREKEREKDRLAVDRAIREARERARERAERAAVEKATEEIRQRMRADAQQKAAKASAQSKLRAERAAVERATSEARQRALEKAMTKKPLQDSSRTSNGTTTSESALRSKAKLEKDNRIMERAAKALAEKEKRDLLAQKEEAERNRLAENLDADIKRWSNGKEGNLRALLSTLQYILGGESGWQPIPLTEIIGRSAVKKAYRKATLCVHPDKLQQRGASIQHKYICEKVFDLLKAAWNKFNSEER